MKFDIISIFPKMFDSYFGESILKRAQEAGLIQIAVHNLRDYTLNKHHNVDDTPYGGGAGMVMQVEPIDRAIEKIKTESSAKKIRTILFAASGKRFMQKDARRLAEYEQLIFVCGRYEGVDARVGENLVDEEISIGDFVLTGGELPALVVVDAVSRMVPNVLGNEESIIQESHSTEGFLEYPQYTKPENYKGWKVPEVLLSGNHKEIQNWRAKKSQEKQSGNKSS